MPNSVLPQDHVILPTLVLGPRSAEGRDFQILAQSDAMSGLNPDEKALLYDLPLALSAWASERGDETDIIACIPLGPPPAAQIVLRAVELGRTGIGSLVYGNAILLSPAMARLIGQAPERLLPFIPLPDGSTHFADQQLTLPLAQIPAYPPVAWPGLGLAWRNRLIRIDHAAQRENALCSALSSIDPPGQRSRVRGWTTSAHMVGIGSFNPARAFQCIVTSEAAAADTGGRYLDYAITATGPAGATVLPPQVFDSWQGFARLFGATDQAVPAWAQWRAEYATLDADALYASLMARAEAVLAAKDIHALIAALAAKAVHDGADASSDAAAMGRAARALFWQRVQREGSSEDRDEGLACTEAVLAVKLPVSQFIIAQDFSLLPVRVAQMLSSKGQIRLIECGLAFAAMDGTIDSLRGADVVIKLAGRTAKLRGQISGPSYFTHWLRAALAGKAALSRLDNSSVSDAVKDLVSDEELIIRFRRLVLRRLTQQDLQGSGDKLASRIVFSAAGKGGS